MEQNLQQQNVKNPIKESEIKLINYDINQKANFFQQKQLISEKTINIILGSKSRYSDI
ncbi:unnamed protein product [Paramecium sonneborni]|uniref:Uncharacterized protein n=1 Tax=Paramecium sonneborni TaxID=65129 RepID=A0A8S1RMI6_9CILI|nr:unnamed protein product [Paramecium sonneborni]